MQQLSDSTASASGGNTKARLIGVGTLALGLGMGWFFGVNPLQAMRDGAAHVEYQLKIFILAPMLLVAGMFLIVGGSPVLQAFSGPPKGRQQHLIVWCMLALAVLTGGLAFWWLQAEMRSLGYH